MRKYTVSAVLGLNPGTVLGLTHQQAGPRAHALKAIKVDHKANTGVYEVISRVEFKVGEEIYTDADLNKALASSLEPEGSGKAKAAGAGKSAAAEKELAELKAKAKAWDELQPELESLQMRAALWDRLPEAVRTEAIAKAEAELIGAKGK